MIVKLIQTLKNIMDVQIKIMKTQIKKIQQVFKEDLECLPAMWETWVQSLSQEDPLEKEMTTHSSILAWKIPWMEEPGKLLSMGSQRVGHD